MFKKKGLVALELLSLIAVVVLFLYGVAFFLTDTQVQAGTWVRADDTLTIAAVDATLLDGTTSGQTFMASDRLTTYSVLLDEFTDAVEIHFYSTGSDTANDTAKVNIYGYSADGPAVRIYEATTVTLGTAVSPDEGLYADAISGTDKHITTVNVKDEAANTVAKMTIDTVGLKYLYFEPETFTGITNLIVKVRQYGAK
jgi:uncharacterized protein (UPF0333 family)